MAVIGIGVDIVDITAYAQQLARAGTTMRNNFTARELSDAKARANYDNSLAGRWAAKEAVIKAWSASRFGYEEKIPAHTVRYNEIEVITDIWDRPKIFLHGKFAHFMSGLHVHISISHDGNIAAAFAVIEE